ncbi:MAG TPA: hypothetical protein VGC35_10330 [Allosphingosinicella sp.]|jgi:hypothetical protein
MPTAPNFAPLARSAALAALAFVATAAVAAPPAPGTNDSAEPIVVTGTVLTPDEAERRANEFIRSTGVAKGMKPAARWGEPVCPRVIGLRPDQGQTVLLKMRAVAQEAGISLGREGCDANITVSFTADAGAIVREVQRRSPGRLREVPAEERAALLTGPAPIRWWYSTDVQSRTGGKGQSAPAPWFKADASEGASEGGTLNLPNPGGTLHHYNSSIVSTQVERVLLNASILIDAKAVAGVPLDALASYAAMVAFAEIRPSDPAPSGSVLALFDTKRSSQEITEQDMAFLRALYRLQLDRPARYHRGILVKGLVAAQKTGG